MTSVESTRTKGTVVYQSIAKDTEVEEKTKVDFQISSGKQEEPEPEKPDDSNQSGEPEKPSGDEGEHRRKSGGSTQPPEQNPSDPPDNNQGSSNEKSKTIPIKLPTSPESFTLMVKVLTATSSIPRRTRPARELPT